MMRHLFPASALLAFFLLLAAAPPVGAQAEPAAAEKKETEEETRWHWTDFEIIGQRDHGRDEIVELLPVELGEPYDDDPELFERCAERLEAELDVASASCSAVRFFDGKAYLLVEIIAKGEESRAEFRPTPEGAVEADAEIFELQTQLMDRLSSNFRHGREIGEHMEDGYLDYRDPEMHAIVEKLRRLAPPHREDLVCVIAEDADPARRARAAWLLNWAGDEAKSIAEVHAYLDDPSGLVRNDVSRFMLHYLEKVEDEEVLRGVIDSLARQLERPGHGDRNKAVYALAAVLEAHPDTAPYMRERAGEWLRRLADQSVLMNVGEPAQKLLADLERQAPSSGE